jgi:formiminotetrahydrofolate cyclodeaminase
MLVDMNVKSFLDKTASKAPVPGGGSVAALSSSLATSLTMMVGNLTIDKEGYEDVQEEMKKLVASLEDSKNEFVELIDKDANSFDSVIEAFKMPKDTEENKKKRSEKIQEGMKYAAKVPLEVAEKTSLLFDYIELVIEDGNKNAVTDGAVAAMMARTAILSALFNVKINLGSIKDEAFVKDYSEKGKKLEAMATEKEQELLAKVDL